MLLSSLTQHLAKAPLHTTAQKEHSAQKHTHFLSSPPALYSAAPFQRPPEPLQALPEALDLLKRSVVGIGKERLGEASASVSAVSHGFVRPAFFKVGDE